MSALTPSRRQFLKTAALGLAGSSLLAACSQAPRSRWRFFSEDEARAVDAITEQIIPTDDFPGAIEAGCLNYIDKQLVGEFERYQHQYRYGLTHLENTCAQQFQSSFAELDWDTQTTVLEALEAGTVDKTLWTEVSPQEFFGLIRDHTLQGFYGSPRHGGNKNYMSYRMLELDYPYVIGQNRYTQGLDKPNGWIQAQ